MTEFVQDVEEAVTKLIGKNAAMRLGIYKPGNISSNNMVVMGYVESIDGALRKGEPVYTLGAEQPDNNSS